MTGDDKSVHVHRPNVVYCFIYLDANKLNQSYLLS